MCECTECHKHSVQVKKHSVQTVYIFSGQVAFTLDINKTLGMFYIIPSVFKTLDTKEHSVHNLRRRSDLTITEACTERRHSAQYCTECATHKHSGQINTRYIIFTCTEC
jgi:hypothetical protein